MEKLTKASCGHTVLPKELFSMSNFYLSNGKRAVRYATYCQKCAKELRKTGTVINDYSKESHWIIDGFLA
jgi:hypothetical protein